MMENKNQRFFKIDYIKPSFIFIYKNMAVRTALLTSRNINLDTDFSKYIESVTDAGIISGFTVTASSVAAGTAWVPCTRTNLETIYALVQNFSAVSISGNGYVIIKVSDSIVDNGGGNEDGTGIATIEVVDTLPSKNYLHLATITNGTVTMVAPTIKKLNELNTEIQSIFSQLADLDERVEHLEEADAIDHLEESGIVWELYTLEDNLFKQYAPTLTNSTLEANVWDVAANTEIHLQAIGSGEASNQLKIKVKMAGSPTTSLVAEVRKGIQVTVTENVEAYWYGDSNNIIATGTLASSSFSSDWAEVTFTLDNNFGGTKWELLDVVLYQTTGSGATVNASNYYVIACDSTQYSEGFWYVSVNGSTRARSKLMPYLSSVWFVQAMLSKVTDNTIKEWVTTYLTNYTGNPTSPKFGYMVNSTEAVLPSKKYCFFEGTFSLSKDYVVSYDVNTTTTANYIRGTATETSFYRLFEGYIDAGKYFYIGHGYQGTYVYLKNITMRMADYVLFKTGSIKWYVNEVKGIGELGTINVFWMLPDGSRNYWPNRHDVTGEIITGNIVPWNYVKFLTIKWSDGNTYKIWVYN